MKYRVVFSVCVVVCLLISPAILAGDRPTRDLDIASAPEPVDPPGATAASDGRIRIRGPVTITESGSYVLKRNIEQDDASLGPAIRVTARKNVTIDLNGFTVTGREPAILAENVNGLTILNGFVEASDRAVTLINVTNFVLRDLTIVNQEDPSLEVRAGERGHVENVATNSPVELECDGCIIIHNRFPQLILLGDGNYVNGNAVAYIDPF